MRVLTFIVTLAIAPLMASSSASPWERPPSFVDLLYPEEALAARVTGAVVVRATTDSSGRVVAAESLTGPAVLATAVVTNVRQWTLSPGVRTETVVYRFEIEHGACNDDRRSLFRIVQPNLAVITACTGPGRRAVPTALGNFRLVSGPDTHEYPPLARSARITGVVVLELSVDSTGAVVASRAVNELPFLSDVAVAHSKTWRLEATGLRRGFVVYEFTLDNRACTLETNTVFSRVTADFVRLSACEPTVNP